MPASPHPASILTTARLTLRLWTPDDAGAFAALSSDPAVTRYLPGPMTGEQASAFLHAQNALFERHACCYFAAVDRASDRLAGFIGLRYQDLAMPFAPCHELGWRLHPDYWGKGLASEGARAVIAYGFDQLRLAELVAFTVKDNLRSRRVMERLGMRHAEQDDFDHPALAPGHALARHVLYRIGSDRIGSVPR